MTDNLETAVHRTCKNCAKFVPIPNGVVCGSCPYEENIEGADRLVCKHHSLKGEYDLQAITYKALKETVKTLLDSMYPFRGMVAEHSRELWDKTARLVAESDCLEVNPIYECLNCITLQAKANLEEQQRREAQQLHCRTIDQLDRLRMGIKDLASKAGV